MTTRNAWDILQERGFIYQATDAAMIQKRLGEGPITFYIGFDPTGSSLHIGHLLPIMAMRWLQACGHRPLALVGGGTAMIGDPSGKMEARPIMTVETIDANVRCLQAQLSRFLDFGEGKAQMVNNAEWLRGLKFLDFLRDIGSLFSVNKMLTAESVKLRMATGLSFLEFSYPLLQAYDFNTLCEKYGCLCEFGGQDQWGNIVAGVDLTRRLQQKEVYGATFPLLLKSDGTKFGKTAGGAVWLDPNRTSPFEYYQFWRNCDDAMLGDLLKKFAIELPVEECAALAAQPNVNRAKEILAYEATKMAHGEKAAREAFLAAGAQFGFADPDRKVETSSGVRVVVAEATAVYPESALPAASLAGEGLWVVHLLTQSGICKTSSDARRLIQGGAVKIDGEKVASVDYKLTAAAAPNGEVLVQTGKKNFRKVRFE